MNTAVNDKSAIATDDNTDSSTTDMTTTASAKTNNNSSSSNDASAYIDPLSLEQQYLLNNHRMGVSQSRHSDHGEDDNTSEGGAAGSQEADVVNDVDAGRSSSGSGSSSSDANASATGDSAEPILKFFVGGIPPDAWEDDLRRHYSQYGSVKEVQVMKEHGTNRNRGFGFVTMHDASLRESIFKNVHFIKNRKVEVRDMQPDAASNLKRRIFIGGINPVINEDQLKKYFEQFGEAEKVTIMRDTEGKSRRFGFIVFMKEDSLKKVLKNSIHHIDGSNKVEVRAAETRKPASATANILAQQRPPAGPPPGIAGMYASYISQYYGRGGSPYSSYAGYQQAPISTPYSAFGPSPYQYPTPPQGQPAASSTAAAASSYWGAGGSGNDSAAAMAAYTAAYGAQAAAYLAQQQQMQFDGYGPQRVAGTAATQAVKARATYRAGPY